MYRTLKYPLKPKKAQYAALDRMLEDHRRLYNCALEERVRTSDRLQRDFDKAIAFRKPVTASGMVHKMPDLYSQMKALTEIRNSDPRMKEYPLSFLRGTLDRADEAWKAFVSRASKGAGSKSGRPRFKGKDQMSSFQFKEFDGIRLIDNRIHFSRNFKSFPGSIRVHLYRPVVGLIKSCVFTKEAGRWFISLQVDIGDPVEIEGPATLIGIDCGVGDDSLIVTSDGQSVGAPKFIRQSQAEMRVAQRRVARGKRGSKRRRKAIAKMARIHRRNANRRKTFNHRLSARLVQQHKFIALEDLKVSNMMRSSRGTVEEPGKNVRQKAGLNRSFADAALSQIDQFLTYKAESAGGRVIKVDPRNTSRTCNACGTVRPILLSERTFKCGCGYVEDRDLNAAINIATKAVASLEGYNVTHQSVRPLGNTARKVRGAVKKFTIFIPHNQVLQSNCNTLAHVPVSSA